MSEKLTGYILLFLGLLVIVYSAISIFMVFTKKAQPIQLFTGPGISVSLPNTKPTELVPAATLNDISNISAHYLLMSFLLGVGFKLGTLGVQLLRPIEVKLATKQ